jgi:two-component system cell cycle response regulator DivK
MVTILLIEDNEMNSIMLSRRLKRRGYAVLLATDGEQGVAMVRAEQPDVVLMDISLPRLDGLSATRALKRAPETSHIPIIAVTAHAMDGDEERCRAAGVDDYDTKPIELDRLLEKMERLLATKRERST